MKRYLSMAALVIGLLAVIAVTVLRFVGWEPTGPRPGLWLPGTVVTTTVTDWSFTDAVPEIHMETQTWYLVPHSVTVQCVSVDGQLYLASFHNGGPQAPRRRWNQNVARDPRIRLQIGDRLYDRKMLPLTEPAQIQRVLDAYVKKYPLWQRTVAMPEDKRPMIFYYQTEPQ